MNYKKKFIGMKNLKKIISSLLITVSIAPAAYAFVKPTVSVKTFSIDSVGLSKIDSTIFLNIDNPNNIGIELKKVEYKVDINNVKEFAEGITQKTVKVTSSKTNDVEIPVSVNNKKIFSTITSIVKSPEKINYTVKGKVYFSTFLGDIPVPFERSSYVDNSESISKIKKQIKSLYSFF